MQLGKKILSNILVLRNLYFFLRINNNYRKFILSYQRISELSKNYKRKNQEIL